MPQLSSPRSRIEVPADARDITGDFAHRHTVEVRLADPDAMGHVNNARYLTYVEIARVAYYEQVTGNALPIGTHGAEEGMILAEIRMTYRSPAFYGETLTVETRVERIGRTSFGMLHRMTAPASRYGPAHGGRGFDAGVVRLPRGVPDSRAGRLAHGHRRVRELGPARELSAAA